MTPPLAGKPAEQPDHPARPVDVLAAAAAARHRSRELAGRARRAIERTRAAGELIEATWREAHYDG